jgi:hypothetical protein
MYVCKRDRKNEAEALLSRERGRKWSKWKAGRMQGRRKKDRGKRRNGGVREEGRMGGRENGGERKVRDETKEGRER